MDTTTSAVATGVVVTVGQWAQDKKLTTRIFVGFGFMLLFLAVMQSTNQKFAERFAVLIFVASLFYYAPALAKVVNQK